MKKITSRTNSIIQEYTKLHQAKHRKQKKLFLVEGIRTCLEFLQSKQYQAQNILLTEKAYEQFTQDLMPYSTLVILVSQSVIEKLSSHATPSGIVAVFSIPKTKLPEKITGGLVLANITNPGNMGTLIRTAVALQKTDIFVIDGVDVYNPKTIQSTAGTLAHAQIHHISWNDLANHKQRSELVALVVSGGKKPNEISPNSLLVVGNEAHGIPENYIKTCEKKLTLPMPGNAESLNAAVAGSIALYVTQGLK